MNKQYKEIKLKWGMSLEEAVGLLLLHKNRGELVCGDFNGTILYSDTVTMDKAYIEIHGINKGEFDRLRQQRKANVKKQEKEHHKRIPELTKLWRQAARGIIAKDKLELWDKTVPMRLGDLYRGVELGNCLSIARLLNDGGTLDEAKEMILDQDHSGLSFSLVCSMVEEFCDRGRVFADYVKRVG